MVKVSIHHVVGMVAVRQRLMAAAGSVLVICPVGAAVVVGRAAVGIFLGDLERVLAPVVAMLVVEMPVVQVVEMAGVVDGGMSAAGAVLVLVTLVDVVFVMAHRHNVDRGRRKAKQVVMRVIPASSAEGVANVTPHAAVRYELVGPEADHHHHLVCEHCGRTATFEDDRLEEAIDRLAQRIDYAVEAHDITLRGACPRCARRASAAGPASA